MRIGILTFHRAHNYGAVLQAFALQSLLSELGHEVEIIDYRPAYDSKNYKVLYPISLKDKSFVASVKVVLNYLFGIPKRWKRKLSFEQFIEHRFRLSQACYSAADIPGDFDCYMVGSDQVWNKQLTKSMDVVFWGFFPKRKDAKRISYAASMGVNRKLQNSDRVRVALGNFDAISVREESARLLLQPLTENNISVVLDPTLLMKRNFWNHVVQRPSFSQKYILVYEIRTYPDTMRLAHELAKKMDAVVVRISSYAGVRSRKHEFQCETPEAFLGWIKHAACVVTTSFHGTVFSVLFNKPFYALDFTVDSRIASLLKGLDLEQRLFETPIKNVSKALVLEPIDWDQVRLRLKKQREASMAFIENALSN